MRFYWTDPYKLAEESQLYTNFDNYAIRFYNLMSARSAAGVRLDSGSPPSGTTRNPNEAGRERFAGAPAADIFVDDAAERRIANARRPSKQTVSLAAALCNQGLLHY